MITSIKEFKQFVDDAALRSYYDKLVQNGSNEQEALLNTAEFYKLNIEQVHKALNRVASSTIY